MFLVTQVVKSSTVLMVIGDSQEPAVSLCPKPMRFDIYPKGLCYGIHLLSSNIFLCH